MNFYKKTSGVNVSTLNVVYMRYIFIFYYFKNNENSFIITLFNKVLKLQVCNNDNL